MSKPKPKPSIHEPNNTTQCVLDQEKVMLEHILSQKEKLNDNQKLYSQYTDDIKKKMQLVATRDRMLQLSQERNIYKQKVMYVLLALIVSLLVGSISVYTIFNRMK
jgi:hypothetical protein